MFSQQISYCCGCAFVHSSDPVLHKTCCLALLQNFVVLHGFQKAKNMLFVPTMSLVLHEHCSDFVLLCTKHLPALCCYAQNIFRLCAAMHKTSSGFVLFCTKHLSALCCSAQNIFRFCVVLHKTSSGLVLFCTKHLPALRCSAQNIFLLSVVLHKTFFCLLLLCRKHFSALCCSAENIFLLCAVLQKTFFCFVLSCRKHFSALCCSAENIFLLSFFLQIFFSALCSADYFFLLCVVLHKTFFCFVLFCTTFFCFVLFCRKHVSASCCWPHSISWLCVVLCKTSFAVRCPAQNKSFPVCVLWGKTVCGSVFFARHLLLKQLSVLPLLGTMFFLAVQCLLCILCEIKCAGLFLKATHNFVSWVFWKLQGYVCLLRMGIGFGKNLIHSVVLFCENLFWVAFNFVQCVLWEGFCPVVSIYTKLWVLCCFHRQRFLIKASSFLLPQERRSIFQVCNICTYVVWFHLVAGLVLICFWAIGEVRRNYPPSPRVLGKYITSVLMYFYMTWCHSHWVV